MLLIFVGFQLVELQSVGNDVEELIATELSVNHQHATTLCTSVGKRLSVIKDQNSIIHLKQWLLNYVGENKSCLCRSYISPHFLTLLYLRHVLAKINKDYLIAISKKSRLIFKL